MVWDAEVVSSVVKLSEPINKMLEEYNLTSLKLETHQLQRVKDIVVALEPFKVATTYLCDRKCDLSKAEEIIGFISGELQKNENELSTRLLDRLNARYQIRKNTSLVSMVKFIKNPDQQSTDPLYRMPGRTTIVRNLKSLHVRLFDSETEETSIVTASEDREEVSDLSMTSRLSLLLDQSKISNPVSDTFIKKCIFSLLEEKRLLLSPNCRLQWKQIRYFQPVVYS